MTSVLVAPERNTSSITAGRGDCSEPLLLELENQENYPTAQTTVLRSLCQTCGAQTAKYKCPGCLVWNCSLTCADTHKRSTNCTGVTAVVQRVPLADFTDSTLQRDVRYLDKVAQAAERAARCRARQFAACLQPSRTKAHHRRALPVSVFRKKCEERGIFLHLGPPELSLRRSNTTQLTRKKKRLAWRIEWRFVELDAVHVDPAVSEETLLSHLLERFVLQGADKNSAITKRSEDGLHTSEKDAGEQIPAVAGSSSAVSAKKRKPHTSAAVPVIERFLTPSSSTFPYSEKYHVLLKDRSAMLFVKDNEQPAGLTNPSSVALQPIRWFVSNKEKKLSDVLKNKHIYEFPVFYVVSEACLHSPRYQNTHTILIKEP